MEYRCPRKLAPRAQASCNGYLITSTDPIHQHCYSDNQWLRDITGAQSGKMHAADYTTETVHGERVAGGVCWSIAFCLATRGG